jgi:hypothetical protein
MTLGELFHKLAYGELSNLSLASNGDILVAQQPKITQYVNDALLALYTKFVLSEDEYLIQTRSDIRQYQLVPKFSIQYTPIGVSDTEAYRYIIDSPEEPFKDLVIKIIQVFDIKMCELPLNDPESALSVFTPKLKVLQVPNPKDNYFLNIHCQLRHPTLSGNLSEEIQCPDVLVKALTSHIAYQVYDDMNSDTSVAKAQGYLAKYSSICAESIDRDLVSSSVSQTNTRFSRGGWI